MRFAELGLSLAPVIAILLLYALVIRRHRPSARTLTLGVLLVTGLGAWLIWEGTSEDLGRSERYTPAVLHDGQVVQGHGTRQ